MTYRVEVSIEGCDDHTTFLVDATGAELGFLKRLEAATLEYSEYNCQPKLKCKVVSND